MIKTSLVKGLLDHVLIKADNLSVPVPLIRARVARINLEDKFDIILSRPAKLEYDFRHMGSKLSNVIKEAVATGVDAESLGLIWAAGSTKATPEDVKLLLSSETVKSDAALVAKIRAAYPESAATVSTKVAKAAAGVVLDVFEKIGETCVNVLQRLIK